MGGISEENHEKDLLYVLALNEQRTIYPVNLIKSYTQMPLNDFKGNDHGS